jgi:hypothetical protein
MMLRPRLFAFGCFMQVSLLLKGGILDTSIDAPITPEIVAGASPIIVTGSMVTNLATSPATGSYTSPAGIASIAKFSIPFSVSASVDPTIPRAIPLYLAFPKNPDEIPLWALPEKEPMLLFLKKSPEKPGSFELLYPRSAWLITRNGPYKTDSGATATLFIMNTVKNYLLWRHANPKADITYFTLPTQPGMSFMQNDPSLLNALKIGSAFGERDVDFQTLAKDYINYSGDIGVVARRIVASSGDFTALMDRYKLYCDGKLPGFEQGNFPYELETAIGKNDAGKVMPLILAASLSKDVKIRLAAVEGLRDRAANDPEVYSLLVNLLKDADPGVQYRSMACIYEALVKANGPDAVDRMGLELPAYSIFQKNPALYLTKYVKWWNDNKAALMKR